MKKKKMILKVSENDPAVGYLYLGNDPEKPKKVDKTVWLSDLIGKYTGPSIYLDFKDGELMGIEILGD
ncbi:DUF2283 domain-containing protein [Mucilaginibacter sp. HMF5004]|uniref:DUF2283 domain-containing protein n=1 Tax=Mucilaginibacter rivuli TaxID=2857527 RepID=UPI001C5D9DDB|nr:DUF2283 domain-containing protein [Mucilaginibacter rivuli]MBW4888135.1 DUF2283 domain-containing protein [Mucilaginibacter rivuli]